MRPLKLGSSATTYVIDSPCRPADGDLFDPDVPCEIERIDHYGAPTQHLLCLPHGKTVGYALDDEMGAA